jgi:regulator of protease activity HflC (stomatin/prohibitin superfamily)
VGFCARFSALTITSKKEMLRLRTQFLLAAVCMAALTPAVVVEGVFVAVSSGHVGVWSWMGQIQPEVYTGVTLYNPLFSSIRSVKYIQDTDKLEHLRCVSREGVPVDIPSIEIANRIDPAFIVSVVSRFGFEYDTVLVLRPLGQLMRELCANRTVDEIEITDFHLLDNLLKQEIQRQVTDLQTGIEVNWVRITNVEIPKEIRQKRLELAAEKANKLLIDEQGKRLVSVKQQEAYVQEADNKRALAATMLEAQQIEALAVANAEAARLQAESVKELYGIPGYVEVLKVQALKDNLKVYFGSDLPTNMFLGPAGGTGVAMWQDKKPSASV